MKKILSIFLALVIMGAASFAQDNAPKNTKPVSKAVPRKVNQAQPAPAKAEAAQKAAPQVKTKKDGTPDMRYKENKNAARPAAGKMKKDGTPDMRHKENKDAAAKKN